ncbi:hypothetical protein GDO86_004848 [Hymenochirus boettgeri]|uniref:NAD(P)(+)--arginine ADP-ribosyltransferase n=1 Tax=Hymenochirus boettgeri TaxID=247094 RepID=A0A8T2K6P7_9PIPI|nr:hypothetical protein GDO86_004848 [Hymenochirus boettgeri]
MEDLLEMEKSNEEFGSAWEMATDKWEKVKRFISLPKGFRDEHGIALLTFTNQYPQENPINQQLNSNMSVAGISRDRYMKDFHFKALHFYLTRALQLLKPNCDTKDVTFRGSFSNYKVSTVFRFGRFTSTSMKREEAEKFGNNSFFFIETCYGAKIKDFSFYPKEEEILIPFAEKFKYVTKLKSTYILQSIGQQCSYFNCAYLGVSSGVQSSQPFVKLIPCLHPIPELPSSDHSHVMQLFTLEYK